MNSEDISVCFDEEYRVRVLDSEKFQQTEQLEQECKAFVEKISDFNGTVKTLVEVLETQARKIEVEKLKAIGQRNKVDSESENRARLQQALLATINEKMSELDRYNEQHQSLLKVESEQLALIEKLSNNEA